MSKRDDLLNDIKSALENIKVSNGYNFDVSYISTKLEAPDELAPDDFPALFIVDTDENKEDTEVNEMQNQLRFIISGYVKDDDDPDDSRRKLLEDVEKAICADRYRNGIAVNTMPANIKTDHGTFAPFAVFDFEFVITYFQEYGTP